MKILNFLSTLFGNKNFISQESAIFADFKNIIFYWIKVFNLSKTDKIYTLLEIFWEKK